MEIREEDGSSTEESDGCCSSTDAALIKLHNLMMENKNDEIKIEVEQALKNLLIGGISFQGGIKRKLMAHLRRKGFDAGELFITRALIFIEQIFLIRLFN